MYELYYGDKKHHHFVKALDGRYKMYNKLLDDLERPGSKVDLIYPPSDFRVERNNFV